MKTKREETGERKDHALIFSPFLTITRYASSLLSEAWNRLLLQNHSKLKHLYDEYLTVTSVFVK